MLSDHHPVAVKSGHAPPMSLVHRLEVEVGDPLKGRKREEKKTSCSCSLYRCEYLVQKQRWGAWERVALPWSETTARCRGRGAPKADSAVKWSCKQSAKSSGELLLYLYSAAPKANSAVKWYYKHSESPQANRYFFISRRSQTRIARLVKLRSFFVNRDRVRGASSLGILPKKSCFLVRS